VESWGGMHGMSAGRAEGTVALDAALVADGGAQLRPCPGEAPAASVRPPPDERVQHSSQLGKVAKGSLKEATSLSPLKAWPDPPAARSFFPSFPGSHTPSFFAKRRWNPRTHPSIPILIMCVDSNYVVDRPVSRFAASGLQAGKKGPSREIEMGAAPSSSSLIPDASAARATGARCSHTAPTHTPPARACPSGGCQMVCVLVPAWQPVPFSHWLTPVLCVRRRNCRCLW
jgi:hypothetical protein